MSGTARFRSARVNRDLAGLPPTLVQVGSTEVLRYDAELMTQRLAEGGVPVRLQIWDRQIHCFHVAADVLPEARAAVRELASFVRTVTSLEGAAHGQIAA